MNNVQLVSDIQGQITGFILFSLCRGVTSTIGKSDTLPQDKLVNMIKRRISEKATEVHQLQTVARG